MRGLTQFYIIFLCIKALIVLKDIGMYSAHHLDEYGLLLYVSPPLNVVGLLTLKLFPA